MNYLAHIFLSGNDENHVIGNFIGDYVKGKQYKEFPEKIRKGILMHRYIDSYTDSHTIVHQSKRYFAKGYHKYSGIIIDILYDHFLTKNWDLFCPVSLPEFKENVHEILKKYYNILPERVQFFVPSFIKNDWIEVYRSIDGIASVLERMSIRTTLPNKTEYAIEVLRKYYIQLDSEFKIYFPDIIKYIVRKFEIIIPLKDNQLLI
jgi:acyl carrier protein phosphodiesterase